MSEQSAKDFYPYVNTEMLFAWVCTECNVMNQLSYTHYTVYKGLAECRKCEKAHWLRVPWENK